MKELLRKKSIKIALLLIMAAVIAVIVGMNVRSAWKEKEYHTHIEAAEKYLTELDYEQAIAEYTLALEIEPNAEEVLNGLEKTYLAYADALLEAGDYEKAIQILNEGYAQTGRESLQEKLAQIQEMQAQAEEHIKVEEEKKAQTIELPLDNITICGYGLDGDYFEQIHSMYPTEDRGGGMWWGTDDSKGYYYVTKDSPFGDNRTVTSLNVQSTETSGWSCQWYSDADGCYQITLILHNDGQSEDIPEINVPIGLGDTYEDWCRVMKIDQIKEKGQKSVIGDDWCAWSFVTDHCEGTYDENNSSGYDFRCEIDFPIWTDNEPGWNSASICVFLGQDERINQIEICALLD